MIKYALYVVKIVLENVCLNLTFHLCQLHNVLNNDVEILITTQTIDNRAIYLSLLQFYC
jgi:hypothetical protein